MDNDIDIDWNLNWKSTNCLYLLIMYIVVMVKTKKRREVNKDKRRRDLIKKRTKYKNNKKKKITNKGRLPLFCVVTMSHITHNHFVIFCSVGPPL